MKNDEKTEIISENMMELGKKFTEIARNAGTAKQARTAFDLAERAYKMVLKTEESSGRIFDGTMVFLSAISESMLRSDAWKAYCVFCLENNQLPTTKSEFFRKMALLDFTTSRKSEGFVIKPPRNKPQILIEAAGQYTVQDRGTEDTE